MAIKALTKSDSFKYVSDKDPAKSKVKVLVDESDPSKGEIEQEKIDWSTATVFHLRSLDVFLMGHIYDNASLLTGSGGDSFDIKTRINQTNIDAVRFGLVGFDNFADDRGVGIKFKTVKKVVNGREYDALDDDILNSMGLNLIGELAGKIKEASEVSAEDEKKFV